MKKLFKKTLLGLASLSLLAGGLAFLFKPSNVKTAKADGIESITLSDCYFSGSDYQNAANGTGLSVDNDLNHWGKYDWTANENTIDLHFNAVVGTAESEFYVYLGNHEDEGGCIFLIQFQATGLMTYAYSSLNTFQNAVRWDSLGFTGSSNEFYLHLNVVFDDVNNKVNATIDAINLTRNANNPKTRTVNNIALSDNFDNEDIFVRLFRRGSVHDITLYDHWNKITFVDDNGSTVRQVNRNAAIGTLPTPFGRFGANFLGWFDENGNEVTAATLSTKSMTVTAKYSDSRPFKSVTLRDVEFKKGNEGAALDQIELTGDGTNFYGNYDIFAASSENKLNLYFKIKFNEGCIAASTGHGLALDIHFPNKLNDGTPKSRIYFGKDYFSAYFCQGSWDGFVNTYSIKFNDTDTFLMNFAVTLDGSNITMSATATNLTTDATGTLTRTFTMTNVPTTDHTKIRISNISDNGGVKATLTNAWDATHYIKYVNGDDISALVVDKGDALTAAQVTSSDTDSQLFYRYEDENGDPVREGYIVNRDTTLTATYINKTANGYAKQFVERYMKPAISTSDVGTGKCTNEGWYTNAKAAFNALSVEARTEFLTNAEFAEMKDRLAAWANANGDQIVDNQISSKSNLSNNIYSNNTLAYIVVIAFAFSSILIIAAGYILNKKKKTN